jgi:hypothetical protein
MPAREMARELSGGEEVNKTEAEARRLSAPFQLLSAVANDRKFRR